MLAFVLTVLLMLGISTLLWSFVGLARALTESQRPGRHAPIPSYPRPSEVAVLIPAHNEGRIIAEALRSVLEHVPAGQVFVVSDGSTDDTAAIARSFGVNVLDQRQNRGKAAAMAAAIDHFGLDRSFEVVLFLDADSRLAPDYLDTGLPLFADPAVVAVAGRATTLDQRPPTRIGRVLTGYRERLYVLMQCLQKFGQAAPRVNVVAVVPGFASMYRSRVLSSIDIDAPGLAIEDFNMTFEVHAKQLGRIAFHPNKAVAFTQDPDTLPEYGRQVTRWSLGFWQTVRRHRFRLRKFWAALTVSTIEVLGGSVLMVLLLPLLVLWGAAWAVDGLELDPSGSAGDFARTVPALLLTAGMVLADYVLTVVAALLARNPRFLIVGLVFPVLRVLDAVLCLRALVATLSTQSTGAWQSPERRLPAIVPAAVANRLRGVPLLGEQRDQVRA